MEQENSDIIVRNILSVDFDCIMYPCIQLYNDHVFTKENATQTWNNLKYRYDIMAHISYDANVLAMISKAMLTALLHGARFTGIQNHEEILDHPNVKKWIKNNERIRVFNIDHHHDLGYNDDKLDELMNHDVYDCTNWVEWLYRKGHLEEYTWVKSPNSDTGFSKDFNVNMVSYQEFEKEIGKLKGGNIDEIFFCLSPQWVPYEYHHLYKLISDMLTKVQDQLYPGVVDP